MWVYFPWIQANTRGRGPPICLWSVSITQSGYDVSITSLPQVCGAAGGPMKVRCCCCTVTPICTFYVHEYSWTKQAENRSVSHSFTDKIMTSKRHQFLFYQYEGGLHLFYLPFQQSLHQCCSTAAGLLQSFQMYVAMLIIQQSLATIRLDGSHRFSESVVALQSDFCTVCFLIKIYPLLIPLWINMQVTQQYGGKISSKYVIYT